MVVMVKKIVSGADTAEQGEVLLKKLQDDLRSSDGLVTVSFEGIHSATSSFVNVAFVSLLTQYDLAVLKRRLRVTKSTRQINEMIKSRLEREALAHA